MTLHTEPQPEPPFEGTPRFEVRTLLGRGANGVVYRALDRETGREVALKTISAPDAEQLYHLKAEFRSLARISHPGLVQLDELTVAGPSCFFTMELLEGETFKQFADRVRGEGWTDEGLDRLTDAARQLVSGISALHAESKLHRDIKPTNILVTHDGRAVLVDFGLCTDLRLVERAKSGLVGTLLYMPPEQAWGKPLGPAADWYALGACLYEAVVGHPPFEGMGTQILFAKNEVPRVPDGLPERACAIAELAAALMSPEPSKRPPPDAVAAALRSARKVAALTTTAFVGRRTELGVLEAALRDVAQGRPAVASVEGPSGIGKTELVERFLTDLERKGGVVFRGRCHPRESIAYNGFDGVVDALSEWLLTLPPAEAIALSDEDAGALRAVFPVLARVRWPGRTDEDEPFELRRRAFRALRQLLARIAEHRTVAVLVDDVQWGGADTAALLTDVFRATSMPRVLLVLTYRTEDQARSTLLTSLRAREGSLLDTVHRAELGPLAPVEARALAAQILGDDAPALEPITREAAGHPLFLRELALAAAQPEDGTGEIANDLRALLRDRIARLRPAERDVLAIAATAGRPLPRRIALAATARGEKARPDVVRLAQGRLLRETEVAGEPAIEPYHGAVRDAALGVLAEGVEAELHRALADALVHEPDAEGDIVEHLLGARDPAGAARYAGVAASKAERALAFDRAIQLYRLALEHGEGERRELRVRLASALANAGRSREAAQTYAEAAREAGPSSADLERQAAEHFLRGGHLEEGIARLRHVLADAGVSYPTSPATAFATVVALRSRLAIRGLGFRPTPEATIAPADLARADACWTAGIGLAWVDRTRTAAFQARYMLLALDGGEPSRVARALATEASQLAAFGGSKRVAKGRAILEKALEMSEKGDAETRAFGRLMAGTIEFYSARYDRALAKCEEAEAILRTARIRSEWELMTSHTLSLASLAYLGDLRTLRARQADLLASAEARGNLLTRACLASGPANVGWLVADDPDEAARRNDAAIEPWREDDFQLPHYLHLVAAAQIALYRGDAAEAWDRLQEEWPRVRSSMSLVVQNFRVTLVHLRARAAIALARKTEGSLARGRLLRRARRDAASLLGEDVAWASPLASALEGELAVLAGDRERAIAKLARASDAFRDLKLELYASAADHERGRIAGGDVGRKTLHRAEAWMVDQRVGDPPRLAAMLMAAG